MKHRALLRAGAAFSTAALLLTACATDSTDDTSEPSQDNADVDGEGEDADPQAADPQGQDPQDADPEDDGDGGSDTVTLLTHDSFNISESVLASFTAETGITVQLAPSGDAGEALNQAILTADAPQGDLLFGVDNTFLSRALDADLFVAYESPELANVPDELVLDPEFRATPATVGDVCLNYDVAAFDEDEVPTELADLTDPALAGELAVMNPATSSPGLAFLLATIAEFGEDGYLDYWEDLVDNDVLVVPGWSEGYYDEFSGVSDGDRSLIVSYATSPAAEVFYAEEDIDPPTGAIDASCFRQIEFVGVLAGADNPEGAEQLIDFMLSTEFQEDLPLNMWVHPVRNDVTLPEVFDTASVEPDMAYEMDPTEIGEQREAWIDEWTATVLR